MKKYFCLMMAAILALTITACSGSSDSNTSIPTTSTAHQDSANSSSLSTTTPAEAFQEIVLVDNDSVTFKITAVETDNFWGYTLKVFLENKTDKELMFALDNVSVNGYMCDPLWASTVDTGKKANEKISFSEDDFSSNGIETVTDITFTLRVYDSNDWMADDIISETFTVNP